MSGDVPVALPIHAPADALAALGALPHEVACLARSLTLRTRSITVTRAGYTITPHVGPVTHLPHGWMGCELDHEACTEHDPSARFRSAQQVGTGIAVRCVCWHVVSGSHTADCPAADAGDLLPPWREVQVEVREYAGKDHITGKPRFEVVTVRKLVPPREIAPVQVEQTEQPAHAAQPSHPELVAVLDTETTGLKRGHDGARITEIAVAITDLATGEIVKRASSLLSIDVPVPADITALTGITSQMLAGKPALIDVWPRVVAFVGDLPVIAHNAAFDRGQLEDGLGRAGVIATEWPRWRWHDSKTLAQQVVPGLPSYSLSGRPGQGASLRESLKLPGQTAHRALGDVLTVCALLRELRLRAGRPFSEWCGPAHVWGVGVEKPEKPARAAEAVRASSAPKGRTKAARSKEAVSDQPDLFITRGVTT